MKTTDEKITLAHGSGGKLMHDLIESVFISSFGNPVLREMSDSAIIAPGSEEIAFTTDSFVIDPLFFPGGDIGRLSVCGTVNDLAVTGADPMFISVSMIIEEGFPLKDLLAIAHSIADEARKAGVIVVTGDTKVVNRGKCDKLFITTSGIGRLRKDLTGIRNGTGIVPGDHILISGTIGDHGMAVMNARESFSFRTPLASDCASLNGMIAEITARNRIKFMRDPTRGGIASVLNEIAVKTGLGIETDEESIPVKKEVKALSELLGIDPVQTANEGKVIIVASPDESAGIIRTLREHEYGKDSAVIGRFTAEHPGKVIMRSSTGGSRYVETISGDQLPRIC